MNSQMQTAGPQKRILDYMLRGGRLTVQKGNADFGTTETRKVISRLREKGIPVKTASIIVETSDGRRQQVNEYFIEQERKETCHIPEEIYVQVASYIMENKCYEGGRTNCRSYVFSFNDEHFEAEGISGFVELVITGKGYIHYSLSPEQWGTEEVFDSLGKVCLECLTYDVEGVEMLNDFNVEKLSKYLY